MTRATTSTVTVKEHRFEVPNGGDMKDLGMAYTWAQNKARELGLDISYDDWATISSDEDGFAFVITERIKS